MQKGFTLIELMITLAVLMITLGLGVPSFVDWMKTNRINTDTGTVAGVLQLARSAAVSQQATISIRAGTVASPGNWANGAHIYTDTGSNGNAYDSATDTLIKNITTPLKGITINSDDPNNIISFSSSGLLNEGTGVGRTITLCQNAEDTEGKSITISFVGRTSIDNINTCNP